MDQSLGWVCYKDIISVTVLMVLSLRNAPEDKTNPAAEGPRGVSVSYAMFCYSITGSGHVIFCGIRKITLRFEFKTHSWSQTSRRRKENKPKNFIFQAVPTLTLS